MGIDPADNLNPTTDAHADAERDAKIESLLLGGLDHYFAMEYAQAIDVWTRALFLDRNHARARAYIERARSALAERQRESDELLHNGIAAFERGEMEAARQLLNAAVQRGGAHEVALAFLTRIDRINAAAPAPSASALAPVRQRPEGERVEPPRTTSRVLAALALTAVIAVATGAAALSWDNVRELISGVGTTLEGDVAPRAPAEEPLFVPRSAETALERARALFMAGKPYDALRTLDSVRSTDAARPDADRLKAVIQQQLLDHYTAPTSAANP